MRFEVGNLQLFGIDIGSLAQRFRAGLQDIMPSGLVECFVRPAPTIEALIEQDGIQFIRRHAAKSIDVITLQHSDMELAADGVFNADLVRGVRKSQLQLHLVLPEEHVMRRRITLPRVARNNLRTVVGYQIGRLTPFSVDKVFFDVLEVSALTPNKQTIEVEFIAVLKTEVQPWVDQIERVTGLTVSRLTVPSVDGLINQNRMNLFALQRTRNAWWLRLNRNSMLLFVLITLLLVTAIVPVIKLHTLMIDRKDEIKVLSAGVTDLQEKRQVLEHDLVVLNYVLEQRASSRELSSIIEELSRVVPDEIFINSLSVQNQAVAISGIGTSVVDLIGLLNSSPLFEDARFTASVTRGRDEQDIFTASMQLSTAVGDQ